MNIMYFGKIGHSNRNTINTFIRVIENYSKTILNFIYTLLTIVFLKKKFKNTNVQKLH